MGITVEQEVERDLLRQAKRQRAGLREIWKQARKSLPARRQGRIASELAKIEPVSIKRNGKRVPCEKSFKLKRAETRTLVKGMLEEGAGRSEVLAGGFISADWLRRLSREPGHGSIRASTADETRSQSQGKHVISTDSKVPVSSPSEVLEGQENALYGAVFAACWIGKDGPGKAAVRGLEKHFPQLQGETLDTLVDRLQRHEGNARCGILSRALPGYTKEQVIRMVGNAATRDSNPLHGEYAGLREPREPDLPAVIDVTGGGPEGRHRR
jgi:hypothetical protein